MSRNTMNSPSESNCWFCFYMEKEFKFDITSEQKELSNKIVDNDYYIFTTKQKTMYYTFNYFHNKAENNGL